MMIIGLTGSIASGKSEAARIFRQAGIPVFDADAEVHALYDSPQGAALLKPVAPAALTHDRVDRGLLSELIRQDPSLLSQVERIVHREIAQRRARFLNQCNKRGDKIVVLDIPLLFETGAEKLVDKTVAVIASLPVRRERAMKRPGMTAEKLEMIMSRQMPDTDKRKRADIVVDNDGTLQEFQAKVSELISGLKQGAMP